MSAKFTPAAWTSIMTWPGPVVGVVRSSIVKVSGPPQARQITARMAPLVL
jgi:hypothetical protein